MFKKPKNTTTPLPTTIWQMLQPATPHSDDRKKRKQIKVAPKIGETSEIEETHILKWVVIGVSSCLGLALVITVCITVPKFRKAVISGWKGLVSRSK